MNQEASLGKVIDRRRRAAGVSIRWLARATGINHTTLWRTIHGKRDEEITLTELNAIARALDIATGDITAEVSA